MGLRPGRSPCACDSPRCSTRIHSWWSLWTAMKLLTSRYVCACCFRRAKHAHVALHSSAVRCDVSQFLLSARRALVRGQLLRSREWASVSATVSQLTEFLTGNSALPLTDPRMMIDVVPNRFKQRLARELCLLHAVVRVFCVTPRVLPC
jgi:hypothetical protein